MSAVADTSAAMLEGVDGDAFAAEAAGVEVPAETPDGAEVETEIAAPDAVEPQAVETPITEEEQPAEEATAPEEEQPAGQAQEEDLPEGVRRGKDRSGKDGLFVTPERWKTIYDEGYKVAQQISEMIGEPLSADAIQVRDRAFVAQERLYTDLLSGDPTLQGQVVRYFMDQFSNARQNGEVGVDPAVPFAEAVYGAIRDSSPEAYSHLRYQAAHDLVGEMYAAAIASKNRSLWLGTSHMAKELGIKYRPDAEMEQAFSNPADPAAAIRAENEALKAQLNGRAESERTAQFASFKAQTGENIRQAVMEEGVKAVIPADVVQAWGQFPKQYEEMVLKPLHSGVSEAIKNDDAFKGRIELLDKQAQRAVSAQKRQEIGEQIKHLYVQRARLAANSIRNRVLQDAAEKLKAVNKQTHDRRQLAANQKGPRGPQNTVPRSIVPATIGEDAGGVATRDSMLADIQRAFQI